MLNLSRKGAFSGRRWKSDSLIDLTPSDHLEEAHVLAVDDSIIDRKVIEKLLRTTSCKVTAVDSGMRALEFLGLNHAHRSSVVDELKIDLIITDYCMPGMTGYELLKRIKESATFKETPVVIMSSENVLTRIDRCLEVGAEEFILKPVKLADVKRLKDYMSREERSKGRESGINKRKQMDGSDSSSSQSSPPSSRSSTPSISSTSTPLSQSPPSITSSMPSSPSGPLDSLTTPSSPFGPSDCSMPSSPSRPSVSPTRPLKTNDSDQTLSETLES